MLNIARRLQTKQVASLFAILAILGSATVSVASPRISKQEARSAFDNAQRMREALNGQRVDDRSKREYQRVLDAYRHVYYSAPTSSKADASVVAVAELLVEMGRAFTEDKSLRAAIGQYEFLRREYPGSRYRFDALFTIAQIYREDLQENEKARDAYEEFIKRYPHHPLAADAREALKEMDQEAAAAKRGKKPPNPQVSPSTQAKETPHAEPRDEKHPAKDEPRSMAQNASLAADSIPTVEVKHAGLPLVTGIRHWSTPDYTRVAIDLETEVKYEAGRVPNPDRIFFDLHDTKLASTLVGKTFDVSDGFLRRVRVAQYQKGLTRVVLEVDDVSDYSAFLLPNPYRLIIDIHGRKPSTQVSKTTAEPKANEPMVQAKTAEPKTESKSEAKSAVKSESKSDNKFEAKVQPKSEQKLEVKTETFAKAEPEKPMDKSAVGPLASASVYTEDVPSDDRSSKAVVSSLPSNEPKATAKPTSEPTVAVVAPRSESKPTITAGKKTKAPEIHQARPTANGERSLVRALGLKIGKIVVDAGHGGHDTGTIGPNGLLEKDLVLDVALRLGRQLERMGADVIYTRDDDTFVPLETRTAIANKNQADLFISIHANSSPDASARGLETYYLNFTSSTDALEVAARENAVSEKSIHELQDLVKKITLKDKIEESREFAQDVQRSLVSGLAAKDASLKDRGVKKAPFIVLIGANMPSILAEISFVSNPGDERRLQTPEYRQKIAESLYKGVQRYINGLSGLKVAQKNGPQ